MDKDEHLSQHRDTQILLIMAVVGEAEPGVVFCGICGFSMSNAGKCPRCTLATKKAAEAITRAADEQRMMDEIEDHLRGMD